MREKLKKNVMKGENKRRRGKNAITSVELWRDLKDGVEGERNELLSCRPARDTCRAWRRGPSGYGNGQLGLIGYRSEDTLARFLVFHHKRQWGHLVDPFSLSSSSLYLVVRVGFSSCVCICLYGPFNCILFRKFSQQLFVFSLCFSGLNSVS